MPCYGRPRFGPGCGSSDRARRHARDRAPLDRSTVPARKTIRRSGRPTPIRTLLRDGYVLRSPSRRRPRSRVASSRWGPECESLAPWLARDTSYSSSSSGRGRRARKSTTADEFFVPLADFTTARARAESESYVGAAGVRALTASANVIRTPDDAEPRTQGFDAR